MKKVLWVVASAGSHPRVLESIEKQSGFQQQEVWLFLKNTDGLPVVYNQGMKKAVEENFDWVVFCHDDVEIQVDDVLDRLEKTDLSMVGVAGTVEAKLESPALWHIMGGGFEGGNLRGNVRHRIVGAHGEATPKSYFGPDGRVVMLDGVFMGIRRDLFETLWFDTDNPSKFHFYDLSYSLESHLNGFRIGVTDIPIVHDSPGLKEFTEEWRAGESWFLNRYK